MTSARCWFIAQVESGAFFFKAEISTTRSHDLLHTAATTLLVAGVDVRTAAGVLGHASPTVTLATYAHLMPEAQREAVDRLGERLEQLAAADFDQHGNRLARCIEKSLQIQAVIGRGWSR